MRPAAHATSSSRNRLLKKAVHQPGGEIEQDEARPVKLLRKRHLAVRPKPPEAEEESLMPSDEAVSPIFTHSLGQGNHDPFDTASIVRLPSFVYGMLDHCK